MEEAGHSPGGTLVVFVGSLNDGATDVYRPGLNEMNGAGMRGGRSFSVTYYDTYDDFLLYVMGYPVELESEEAMTLLFQTEEVQNMPCFPEQGYCSMVENVMVVRLFD